MRKLLVFAVITILALVPAQLAWGTFPASGDNPVTPEAIHWNCPNGIDLVLGGGGGYKQMVRDWVAQYEWLRTRHPNRANWPRIRAIWDIGWDGNARHDMNCAIDVDERWQLEGGAGGWATLSAWGGNDPWYARHIAGCGVLLSSEAWATQNWAVRRQIPYHELYHCIGLGHDDRDHAGHETWGVGDVCRWTRWGVMRSAARGDYCLTLVDVLTLEWTLYDHHH